MKLLLDTHTLIWFVEGNSALSVPARQHIEDTSNELFLSVASIWEMAIKVSIGKLTLAQPLGTLIPQQLALNGIQLLNITISHAAEVAGMPFHHKDPFDRLLIAQALVEGMPMIGIDNANDWHRHGFRCIWRDSDLVEAYHCRCAARTRLLAASFSRSFGGALVSRELSNWWETSAIASTAARKAVSLAFEGLVKPLILRTNCREAA